MFTEHFFLVQKMAGASHEMAQFVLKTANLTISIELALLLKKLSSYGLLRRLWHLNPTVSGHL